MSARPWTVHTGTRPQPVVQLLRDQGRRALHLPLLQTVPVDSPAPVLPTGGAVLVTSQAAARHGAAVLQGICPGRQVLAVGPSTARALQGIGLTVDHVAEGTGAALLAALGSGPAVFVGALRPAHHLRAALEQRPSLAHWPVYDRAGVEQSRRWLAGNPPVDAALFTSPAGVEEWVGASRSRPRAVAIGPTTAEALRAAGFGDVVVAAAPTPAALVAALSGARSG